MTRWYHKFIDLIISCCYTLCVYSVVYIQGVGEILRLLLWILLSILIVLELLLILIWWAFRIHFRRFWNLLSNRRIRFFLWNRLSLMTYKVIGNWLVWLLKTLMCIINACIHTVVWMHKTSFLWIFAMYTLNITCWITFRYFIDLLWNILISHRSVWTYFRLVWIQLLFWRALVLKGILVLLYLLTTHTQAVVKLLYIDILKV